MVFNKKRANLLTIGLLIDATSEGSTAIESIPVLILLFPRIHTKGLLQNQIGTLNKQALIHP
ncbi:hypothetical protein BV899_04985 [Alcaligenes phenolicus]|nr:hypothetical protein BV899_04985 [Alcaligenes phenolicus]